MSETNLEIAKRYLKAIENGAPFEEVAAFFTEEARFGVFLDFRDGRICHQRNYDCFDPW